MTEITIIKMSLTKKKNEIQKSHKSKVNTPINYDKLKKKCQYNKADAGRTVVKSFNTFHLFCIQYSSGDERSPESANCRAPGGSETR